MKQMMNKKYTLDDLLEDSEEFVIDDTVVRRRGRGKTITKKYNDDTFEAATNTVSRHEEDIFMDSNVPLPSNLQKVKTRGRPRKKK